MLERPGLLSAQELSLVRGLIGGKTDQQIAGELRLKHDDDLEPLLSEAMRKAGVATPEGLVLYVVDYAMSIADRAKLAHAHRPTWRNLGLLSHGVFNVIMQAWIKPKQIDHFGTICAHVGLDTLEAKQILLRNSGCNSLSQLVALWRILEVRFTSREIEVMSLVSKGHGVQKIRELLGVTDHTVKTHIRHVALKAHIPGGTPYVALYYLVNYVTPEQWLSWLNSPEGVKAKRNLANILKRRPALGSLIKKMVEEPGIANKHLSSSLNVGIDTVKGELRDAFSIMGVSNRTSLTITCYMVMNPPAPQ